MSLWIKCGHSNESYIEQCFTVVLFILLYKAVLTFEFVVKILKHVHSNERHNESFGAVYHVVQGGANITFESVYKVVKM